QKNRLDILCECRRVLEVDDARERDIEPERHGSLSDLPGFGKAMHHAPDLVIAFFTHDPERVRSSVPHVNDERRPAAARRPDMGTKPLPLPFAIVLDAVIVQSSFPDAQDPGMSRKLD